VVLVVAGVVEISGRSESLPASSDEAAPLGELMIAPLFIEIVWLFME